MRIYVVKSGDYLQKIAHEQLGDGARWPEIAHVNALKHPYTIYPNQVLELPEKNGALTIVSTHSQNVEAKQTGAAAMNTSLFKRASPAQLAALVIAAAAFFYYTR